jgi:glycine/D-amino acid oxidase-like deaminating enzyme
MNHYDLPARRIPAGECDIVVAGGGTGGVFAALAAARGGARTVLIESKGYVGGIAVEGGTALHSFYNLYTAFEGVARRQLVAGLPQEFIDRLASAGGTCGHAPMIGGFCYDSVCTAIDTEIYKLVALEMLRESGVQVRLNTLLTGAIREGSRVAGVVAASHQGSEALMARSFIDCTGYGDLCAQAGARFTEPNDHPVANSIGVGGVSVEGYHEFLRKHDAVVDYAEAARDGQPNRIVRVSGDNRKLPEEMQSIIRQIGMHTVITTLHDGYFMFLKLNVRMPVSPTDRDAAAQAELELRQRQIKAVEMFRRFVPGCEKAFVARSSPSLCIRRGRTIECDYDISNRDIISGAHFEDDVLAYGFHDCAPRLQVAGGGSYGLPYRAMLVSGIDNLYATGMMITSDFEAHMSTRNTVSCMAQGQAAGTAAAICARRSMGSRDLRYSDLRQALLAGGVVLEN